MIMLPEDNLKIMVAEDCISYFQGYYKQNQRNVKYLHSINIDQ